MVEEVLATRVVGGLVGHWPGQFPASFMGDDLASPPR